MCFSHERSGPGSCLRHHLMDCIQTSGGLPPSVLLNTTSPVHLAVTAITANGDSSHRTHESPVESTLRVKEVTRGRQSQTSGHFDRAPGCRRSSWSSKNRPSPAVAKTKRPRTPFWFRAARCGRATASIAGCLHAHLLVDRS